MKSDILGWVGTFLSVVSLWITMYRLDKRIKRLEGASEYVLHDCQPSPRYREDGTRIYRNARKGDDF